MKTIRATFLIGFKGHVYTIAVFTDNGKTRVQVMVGDIVVKDSTFKFKQTVSATTAKKILNNYLIGQ